MRPLIRSLLARRTTPAPTARTGVPTAVPRSIPAWKRGPPSSGCSRTPNAEVMRTHSGSGHPSAYAPPSIAACAARPTQASDRGGKARARSSRAGERASSRAYCAASSPQNIASSAASSEPRRCALARSRGATSRGEASSTAAAPYASAWDGGIGPGSAGGRRGGTSVPAPKYASSGRAVLRVPNSQAPTERTRAPAGVWYQPAHRQSAQSRSSRSGRRLFIGRRGPPRSSREPAPRRLRRGTATFAQARGSGTPLAARAGRAARPGWRRAPGRRASRRAARGGAILAPCARPSRRRRSRRAASPPAAPAGAGSACAAESRAPASIPRPAAARHDPTPELRAASCQRRATDALIAVPLLGYDQREPAAEWKLAREILQRTRSPLRLVRPAATLLVAIAGACSVARTVQGSLHLALHVGWLASLARAATLVGLLVLLAPRAAFRSLELARTSRYRAAAAVVLIPLMIAAVLSFR